MARTKKVYYISDFTGKPVDEDNLVVIKLFTTEGTFTLDADSSDEKLPDLFKVARLQRTRQRRKAS